ncbi:MAG TPA: ATP-dependent Clp protease adaptor ClpS [Kofleriaceae bacterium]|nr:ATP-dependent Clp protease adaptor ClpS [Kofleriaceae bacterium]
MEVLLYLAAAISAAGFGATWWYESRAARAQKQLPSSFEPDAEVALHVAGHEARTRSQSISSLHLLYGLVQDETVTSAIRAAGHDPDRLEDRVLGALAELPTGLSELTETTHYALARSLHTASMANRKIAVADLWAHLVDEEVEPVLEAAGVRHVDVLFRLAHGGGAPEIDLLGGDVHVVLRNDDYSTREFVCEVLREVFGLTAPDAEARMLQTHNLGRGVVGRYSASEARSKIAEVRARARDQGYPLWIGIEPI